MSAEALPIIRVRDLEKVYPGNVHAVRGVSFEVRPKQVVAIIGSSGSGKSTVLRCINRLIAPTKGVVRLKGEQINPPAAGINKVRSRIGILISKMIIKTWYARAGSRLPLSIRDRYQKFIILNNR